jgi:DNA helicase HerA-like ATPase
MSEQDRIFVGGGGPDQTTEQSLLLRYGNRHGLISGATGTGKTITMQILAEEFSAAGVPVFMTDIKGDVSGLATAGQPKDFIARRLEAIGLHTHQYRANSVTFWDMFGENGHPIRATVSELGPLLLSRMLELTDVQEGVINVAFRLSDDEGLPMLDLKDLQSMLNFVGEHRQELSLRYGNVTTASIGAIQRRLLVLENQGAAHFFGEPALELTDLLRTDADGRGQINILHATRLMETPRLYATFLLWLLSELFEDLPEVGDPDKPVLVFFFDEAHLLFNGAPAALVEKVEQVARLIRSKGVGVYFVTQNPDDVPDTILGQLGNRVQHALRAFTARDQKALRRAAQTYRPNPRFDVGDAIRDVGVGEAVTSFLEAKGVPGIVERTLIRPPASQMGPIEPSLRATIIAASSLRAKYTAVLDRDSAYEMLLRRAQQTAAAADVPQEGAREFNSARRYQPNMPTTHARATTKAKPRSGGGSTRRGDTAIEAFTKSFARSIGSNTGRAFARGILGGLFRSR